MDNEKLHILCIDDDAQIRFALKAVFDSQSWDSYTVSTVLEGLEIFKRDPVDLVLIDYHLPGINGIDGVRMLRKLSATIPIIVFTIAEDQRIANEFLREGASDFALKPIKVPDIISRIRLHVKLLESQRREQQSRGDDIMPAKGIQRVTLEHIENSLRKSTAPVTVQQVAQQTGLADQTVYRYLQYLSQEGNIEVISAYGKVGRPKQTYKWLDQEGDANDSRSSALQTNLSVSGKTGASPQSGGQDKTTGKYISGKKDTMNKKTLVMGVIGADVHAVGNQILSYAFREAGFNVINLGVMVSQEEYIEAAIESAADVIVVSSLYGHGELDCEGFRDKCVEAGLKDILLYVGGNIVVGKQPFDEVEKRFKAMGFNRVFGPGTPPETTIAALKEDLNAEG